MLDVLLKSKFYSKCKTALKITKTRIELIKRKRNAIEKFLTKDIADLLKNGLDINAYGRAEGLLIELNMSACYNFVAEFCACLLPQVSSMDKQRDCPDECREAVHSLMYAAARFADLPELRELRALFIEKYGNFHEAYVNREFLEKLKATPPTKEMKIRLLQDITLESGKSWDSKALEQKLYNPPPSNQALRKDQNHTMPRNKDEPVKKINKETSEDHVQKRIPSPPRKINETPSYRERNTNVDRIDRYKVLESEENNVVYVGVAEKVVTSFNKIEKMNQLNLEIPLHSKVVPPPPYNKRNSSESKYKTQVSENNGVHFAVTEKVVTSFNKIEQINELTIEKSFQSKVVPPPPYNSRSNSESKYEPQVNRNNTARRGLVEDMQKNNIQGKSSNENEHRSKSRSRNNRHDEKTDETRHYQRKFAPISYQQNSEKTFSRDIRVANQNKTKPKTNEHLEIPEEKKQFESKFAPPAPYTRPNAVTSTIEEKTHQQDHLTDRAKPKPRSVRSVRSIRSIVPPAEESITKNDDILDEIRQELSTKPGHKSTINQKEDEKINELLMHYCKRESPRRGRGLQYRT